MKAGITIKDIGDIGGSDKEVLKRFNDICKFARVPNNYNFNDISTANLR